MDNIRKNFLLGVNKEENKIYFGEAPEYNNVPRLKKFENDLSEIIPENVISDSGTTKSAVTANGASIQLAIVPALIILYKKIQSTPST